jgi:magnesium-protoporphyrin O-methyltransferase
VPAVTQSNALTSYERRRSEVETYFDRTAADAWRRLTSDAPVSGIRATVRAGRDRMRDTLLSWLPEDLTGRRVLDAGCGTGALSMAAAARGAAVVAIDLSPTLVDIARQRAEGAGIAGIDFRVGDLLAPDLGRFDHIVSMDVLIHYGPDDVVAMLRDLAVRAQSSVVFTIAPRTRLLMAMHAVGRLFPRSDRAPGIEPLGERRLAALVAQSPDLAGWRLGRSEQVTSGFYLSCAQELVPA